MKKNWLGKLLALVLIVALLLPMAGYADGEETTVMEQTEMAEQQIEINELDVLEQLSGDMDLQGESKTPLTYTVSFDSNGGTPVMDQEVEAGSIISRP